MESRPYKVISGVSYPNLFVDDNQPTKIGANIDEESRGHYYDTAIRLSKKDVEGFVGKPLCLEHDESCIIGKITAAWVDRDQHMRLTGRIYTDTAEGESLYQRINAGDLSGLSVGYSLVTAQDNPNEIIGKRFSEVSVCERPFFPGAEIRMAASEKSMYKTKSGENCQLVFKIMASEVKNSTPEIAEPAAASATTLESRNKDGSEMARVHDDLLRKSEEQAARLKELEERNAQFERLEQQRREQYAESNKPLLDEVLAIHREQYREEKGPNAELSEDFVVSTTAAFMAPEAAKVIEPIVASARSWKKQRDARLAQEEQLKVHASKMAELEEKLKKMSEDQSLAMTHVNASQRRLQMGKDEDVSADSDRRLAVQASGSGKLDISHLFIPQPSEMERQLYQMNFGRPLDVKVTASQPKALASIPEPLNENIRKHTPQSQRYDERHGGKYIFHHLVANAKNFSKFEVPVQREVTHLDQ